MDDASRQLLDEVQESLKHELAAARPLLHDLDQAWLLQLGRPSVAVRKGARFYYNLLIFKWTQNDATAISSVQWDPIVTEIEALSEDLRTEISIGRRSTGKVIAHSENASLIDAVVVSASEVTNKTLMNVHADVPVFASAQAAEQIQQRHSFRNVIVIPRLEHQGSEMDWRVSSLPPLPEWLGISLVPQDDTNTTLMVTFLKHYGIPPAKSAGSTAKAEKQKQQQHATNELDEYDGAAEAIVYAPSVYSHEGLEVIATASPPISTLALLYEPDLRAVRSVREQRTPRIICAQRYLNAKYWVTAAGEVKQRNWLSSWFAPLRNLTPEEVLNRAVRHRKTDVETDGVRETVENDPVVAFQDVQWLDLSNGTSKVLR